MWVLIAGGAGGAFITLADLGIAINLAIANSSASGQIYVEQVKIPKMPKIDEFVKSRNSIEYVIPAKAGSQLFQGVLDPGFRRGDDQKDFLRDHQNWAHKKFIISYAVKKERALNLPGLHQETSFFSSPSPRPSPARGISANLINGGVFEKIPIGIFDNRPAIYRR